MIFSVAFGSVFYVRFEFFSTKLMNGYFISESQVTLNNEVRLQWRLLAIN